MAYRYNKERIKEFAEKRGFGGRTIANKLGMSNDKAPRSWLDGSEVIRMDHFLNFVNTFNLDLHEFFFQDDVLMSKAPQTEQSKENTFCSPQAETKSATEAELRHVREMADLEKQHLREMMQKDIDLAKKEVEMREQIRRELKAEFEADKQQIIESYEDRLRDRDNDVAKLQQQVAELTVQYRELESSQGEKGYYPKGTITGVAESAYRK